MSRKLFLAALGTAIVTVAAVLTTQIASAHSRPIRFDPAPGSVLTAAPPKVTGWFNAAIRSDTNWSFIHVTDEQGNRVDNNDVSLSSDRLQMSVTLKSGLANGRYLVTWRTYDDGDGAIFGQCYTFFVGQAAADAAVTGKARLDGGGSCQSYDYSAKAGTPVPGSTPTGAPGATDADAEVTDSGSSDSSSGVPVWTLALAAVLGVVAGGVGGRFVGGRS